MMQIDVKNVFNRISRATIFRELCVVKGPLVSIIPFTKLFYGAHFSIYYQHGRHVEGVAIIESSSSTRQGDPLKGYLFILAHYQALLETIAQAPNYVFPSLVDDIRIVGPMNEITSASDHLLTQLTQVGIKIKVSKCKLWNPSGIFLGIEIPQGYTLVINGLCILGVLIDSQDFAMHFLDEVLSQDMVHINDLPLLGNA